MSRRFTTRSTPLRDVFVLTRSPRCDARGHLERLYCASDLGDVCETDEPILQINHTLTRTSGTIRGMHYQRVPHADRKIVSCIRGEVYDVVVDLRPESPTYLGWHAELLSADNHRSVVIPKGCAHGFQAVSPDCELLYFHTALWHAESEAGVHPLDPLIGIAWPLPVSDMSDRDRSHPLLDGRSLPTRERSHVA